MNNPWKFAADYYDSSTGLYKFGVRSYDPSLGRWTQQDPVGGSLGDLNAANRYTYANDDPVNVVDPSGKGDVFLCALGVLGAIGGIGAGLVGIIVVVITAGPEAAGLALLAAYLGLTVGFLTYIAGVAAALATWYAGVCSF